MHFSGGSSPRFTKVHTAVRAERTLRASSLIDAATRAPLAGTCAPESPTGSALLLMQHESFNTLVTWLSLDAFRGTCTGPWVLHLRTEQ